MSVIPLTVFVSLGLALFFALLFLREQRRRRFASAERDSLLPLAAEQPRVAGDDGPSERGGGTRGKSVRRPESTPEDHASPCGCVGGARAICAHCQQRPGHFI